METGAVAEALQTARVAHAVGQIVEGQIAFPHGVPDPVDDPTALDPIENANPDARSPADSAVDGCRDSGRPRAELRRARKRPAPIWTTSRCRRVERNRMQQVRESERCHWNDEHD